MIRIGVDVGGTFTDVTALDTGSGRYAVFKLPTTSSDQSVGVAGGVEGILGEIGGAPGDVTYLGHGTTVATNALLELDGAPTAAVVTKGVRDVLEIARQKRPKLYDLMADKPAPLVARRHTFEARERLAASGEVVEELTAEELDRLVDLVGGSGVEAVAICLLHCYQNAAHEELVEERLKAAFPDAYVCRSSVVAPEFREYERLSTTVVNAFVGPPVTRYMRRLAARVRDVGLGVEPQVIQSNGGLTSLDTVAERPVATLMSGPSAGVVGAIHLAGLAGEKNLITLDMGGTSTDVCLVRDGRTDVGSIKTVGGYPIRVPSMDIHTIGAGGGSVAALDSGGALCVGPESAGSEPGPAAYGRGGAVPTVTDANIVRGRLNRSAILGGRLPVHLAAAQRVLGELGDLLGMTPEAAARGVGRVTNANIARAVRAVSVEIGEDPRDCVMVAFGGAGPLHAVEVARDVGMTTVLVPPNPGILSALGLLVTDIRTDLVRSCLALASPETLPVLNEQLAEMCAEAESWLGRERTAGTGVGELSVSTDLRYARQNFELNVPLATTSLTPETLADLVSDFHVAHEKSYGFCHEGARVQVVNLRVTATAEVPKGTLPPLATGGAEVDAVAERRDVDLDDGVATDVPVYERSRLRAGNRFAGPAVVEQLDATTFVPPDATCLVDAFGNLRIEVGR